MKRLLLIPFLLLIVSFLPPRGGGSASSGGAGLTLQITLAGGAELNFAQASASNCGEYVGPYVEQNCYVQRSGAWTVFFRPDANTARQEVVVELGTIQGEAGAAVQSVSDLGAVADPGHIPSRDCALRKVHP